jgi:hypothetical protein
MTDLLNDPLVVLYFQPDATQKRANADLVLAGMQQDINAGDRHLVVVDDAITEIVALTPISGAMHFNLIRLPSKYQTDKVMVTCPTCQFTYEHQHIFSK